MPTSHRAAKLSARQRRRWYLLRRLIGPVLAAAALFGLIAADRAGVFGHAPPPDREKYHARTFPCAGVPDGDTIDLATPDPVRGEPFTRVRLWGVDTPETVKPDTPVAHFGPEASAYTRSLCEGRDLRIELEPTREPRDRYDRLLAYVYLPDGRMLNRLLVAEGYAYADPRFRHRHQAEFRRLQREARSARRGLWREVTPDDLPYYYRNTLRLDAGE